MEAASHSRVPSRSRPLLRAVAGAILASVAAGAGCAGGSDTERGTQRLLDGIGHGLLGHKSSQEQVLIPVDGPVNVEVHNFAGPVVVRGGRTERTRDALVILDRRGTHEGGRDRESEQSLPEIQWTAELVPASEPGGVPTVRVSASTNHAEPWFQQVDIEVLVNELGRVNIQTRRGKVQVSDPQGPVDIATTKGDVRVITGWPQKQDSVILTTEGDIDFRVRGESAFAIDAETVGGRVYSRCEAGRWISENARNDHDSMFATLNGGGGTVLLRTVDGDIRVAVVGDPHDVGSFAIRP